MKRKKLILFCILTAFAIISAAFVGNGSFGTIAFANTLADENKDLIAQIVNKNNLVSYLYLNNISDIFLDAAGASSDSLYISDTNGVYRKSGGINSGTKLGVTATKTEKAAGQILFLNSTGVCLEGATVPLIAGEFFSFAALNNSIYLITKLKDKIVKYDIVPDESEGAAQSALRAEKSSLELALSDISGAVAGICASSDAVVFYSEHNGANTFYLLTEKSKMSKTILNLMNTDDEIRCVAGNKNSDKLAVLTPSNIYIYSGVSLGKASDTKIVPFNGGRKLSFDDTRIFVSTSRSNIDLIEYSGTEIKTSNLLGSRSNVDWFYSEPGGISVRNEKVYIADTRNNRVVTLDKNGFEANQTPFVSPVAAVVTRGGELIVAHNTNELTNASTGKSLEIVNEVVLVPAIEKMVIDVNNNIYALIKADDEAYLIRTDSKLNSYEILDYSNPAGLGLKTSGQACVYADGKVHFLDGSKSFAAEHLNDFYLDYADNVFGIDSNNKLVVIKNGVKTVFNTTSAAGSQLRFDGISICPAAIDRLAALNDILLLDSTTHSLWKINGASAGVVDVTYYYPLDISQITGSNTHKSDINLLARANSNTYLYSRPVESEINCDVAENQTLFIRLDIKAPENMYFAVTEDVVKADGIIQSGAIKYGYIFRQYVNSNAYSYEQQSSVYGKTLIPSVSVYKYPSIYSSTVSTLNSGDVIKLLDFAPDYVDSDNKQWLRISLAYDCEGFVLAHLISTSLFSNTSQLSANATVSNDTVSYVYDSENKTYSLFRSVAKGTRIEVQTPFDRTKTYTKVLFYVDGELVDIDCYILTSDIEYDGLDIIQIVAVGVIVFTVILAVVLTVALTRRSRRKKFVE